MHVINLNLLIRLRKTNQTKGETERETEGKEEVQKEINNRNKQSSYFVKHYS